MDPLYIAIIAGILILAFPVGIAIGSASAKTRLAQETATAAPAAGGTASASKPFWKTIPFMVVITLVVIAGIAFLVYETVFVARSGEEGSIAWNLVFWPLVMVSLFIAGFILMVLGKKGAGLLLALATVLALGLLFTDWLGEGNVDIWGKRIGAGFASGTVESTTRDLCSGETMVTLQPGEPYTYVRAHGCSTRRLMQWQSTVSAPDIWVEVNGSVGPEEHLMITDESYSYTYPGAISEVTMYNQGDEPATVWFFYK